MITRLKDMLCSSKNRADRAEDRNLELEDTFLKFDEQLREKSQTITSLEQNLENLSQLLSDKSTPKKTSNHDQQTISN